MKKVFIVVALSIFIAITFTFTALKLGALGSQNNYFNSRLRSSISQYLVMRKILGLHYDGDGKSDYLGRKFSKITLEVTSMEGLMPKQEILNQLAKTIEETTGKPTEVTVTNPNIPLYQEVNRTDIKNIVSHYKTKQTSGNTASLFIFVTTKSSDQENLIGTTYEEDSIIIFNEALDFFTKDEPQTKDLYLFSTMLHEFGHQIGLQHNEAPSCLMQATAETNHVPRKFRQQVVTDFCESEKEQIDSIKRRL